MPHVSQDILEQTFTRESTLSLYCQQAHIKTVAGELSAWVVDCLGFKTQKKSHPHVIRELDVKTSC